MEDGELLPMLLQAVAATKSRVVMPTASAAALVRAARAADASGDRWLSGAIGFIMLFRDAPEGGRTTLFKQRGPPREDKESLQQRGMRPTQGEMA